MLAWISGALILSLCGVTAPALAQGDAPASPRRLHPIAVTFGPSIGLSELAKTQFDVTESYAYHFLGGNDGPFAGVELQEGMGTFFRFSVGAKAGYDWAPSPSWPIYVPPDLRIGFSTIDGNAAFNLAFGLGAKYVLPQGVSFGLRAVGINLSFGDLTWNTYDLMAGVGYTF